MMASQPPSQPSQEALDASKAIADAEFTLETIKRSFTATVANRFFVQVDGQGAFIGIGSTGIIAGGILGQESQIIPVSNVQSVFRVETDFLISLLDAINGILSASTDVTEDQGDG